MVHGMFDTPYGVVIYPGGMYLDTAAVHDVILLCCDFLQCPWVCLYLSASSATKRDLVVLRLSAVYFSLSVPQCKQCNKNRENMHDGHKATNKGMQTRP